MFSHLTHNQLYIFSMVVETISHQERPLDENVNHTIWGKGLTLECKIETWHLISTNHITAASYLVFCLQPFALSKKLPLLCNSTAVVLLGCQKCYCQALLPTALRGNPDLAVSFHSASLPSFTQISSSSVNNSWATCSASSSVPRMNWTRWDGVSDEVRECGGGKDRWTNTHNTTHFKKITGSTGWCQYTLL